MGSLSRCLDKLMTSSTSALRRDHVQVLTSFSSQFLYRVGLGPHVSIINNEIMAALRLPAGRCKVEVPPAPRTNPSTKSLTFASNTVIFR